MVYKKSAIELHKKNSGKIEITSKIKLNSKDDLSHAYTPGVAEVCKIIAKNKNKALDLTFKKNTIAIVSDGTSVLGLGDIGPEAAIPVMEGKSILFKKFGGVNALPLCIKSKSVSEVVNFCKMIEPTVRGINLEDIKAPECFEILKKLEKELSIPVFHDDQHGTAIVTLAAVSNAAKVVKKDIKDLKIVINGAGAAGYAIADFIAHAAKKPKEIIVCDSKGIIYKGRKDLRSYKKDLLKFTNKKNHKGTLADAMVDADVFIGVSRGKVVTKQMVSSMAKNAIVFAMANPVPEIDPREAVKAGAAVVGTGRSDFKNQINNLLAFPAIFKGVIDGNKSKITKKMMYAAAKEIANGIIPSKGAVLPSVLNMDIYRQTAKQVQKN